MCLTKNIFYQHVIFLKKVSDLNGSLKPSDQVSAQSTEQKVFYFLFVLIATGLKWVVDLDLQSKIRAKEEPASDFDNRVREKISQSSRKNFCVQASPAEWPVF